MSAILALTVVAGCSSGTEKAPATNETASANAPKEPVTIQLGSMYPNLDPNNPVMQELAKKANVKFDLITVTGDRNQKFDLWLASGDYPADTFVLKPDYIAKYASAGALLPLEGLIEKYGPNIKKAYGDYFDLLKDEDGHIYSLYVPRTSTEQSPTLQGNFAVRYDVLKEAGYPQLKTLDQLFDVLQAYYKAHPTTDGKPVVPFSGFSYSGNGAENMLTPSVESAGLTSHGSFVIDSNNNTKLLYTSDAVKEYHKFLNKLYNADMLDKEFFTLKNDTMSKKVIDDRVLAGFFPSWWVQPEVEKPMRAAGDFEHMYAYFPLLTDEKLPNQAFMSLKTRSNWNWVVSKKSKHPEEVIRLLDYLFTDEAQLLINWGIEGKHYEKKDGKRTVTAEFNKQKTANPDLIWKETVSPFYGTSIYFNHGTKLADGDYATPTTKESVKSAFDPRTKEVLGKYGKEVWADFLPSLQYIPATLGQMGDIEEYRADMKRIEQLWLKESPKMIFAKTEAEFNKLWTDFSAQVEKENAKKIEEAYTAKWKKFVAGYGPMFNKK